VFFSVNIQINIHSTPSIVLIFFLLPLWEKVKDEGIIFSFSPSPYILSHQGRGIFYNGVH